MPEDLGHFLTVLDVKSLDVRLGSQIDEFKAGE
jgi:hypothetical protein